MEVRKKDMFRTGWRRCLEKEYRCKAFKFDEFEGIMSLSKLKKLTAPLVINYEFEDTKIADDNYTWLQFAFRDQNFWLTVMYDDNEKLIQLYFDITNGNYFEDPKNPYFYDLFLDIVVTNQKEMYILDEDELQMALDDMTITKEEYDKAQATVKWLFNYLTVNKDRIIDYCYQCLLDMKQ